MEYLSTRGNFTKGKEKSFKEVTLEGLAPDGGLYIPKNFPNFNAKEINFFKDLSYVELTAEILNKFTGKDLDKSELVKLAQNAYKNFGGEDKVKLQEIDKKKYLLELFHGPTLAFKDFALQLLGGIFDKFLADSGSKINILGATSGDTGSAAIEAFKNKTNLNLFVLHPKGKISEFQRKQMTTVKADNIFNIAIKGNFDDCQRLVKSLFVDKKFNTTYNLASINSINWARVLAQVVYYIYSTLKIVNSTDDSSVDFIVPSGNFGDAYAGYIAKKIGFPIDKIYVATNSNDILKRFFETGIYKKSEVISTLSPSMDIQVASNFERLLYEIYSCDADRVLESMNYFSTKGYLRVEEKCILNLRRTFKSFSVTDDEIIQIIKDINDKKNIILDPHTAVGAKAFDFKKIEKKSKVLLATAHPIKFQDAVNKAMNGSYAIPDNFNLLLNSKERLFTLENNILVLKNFIRESLRSDDS